MTPNEIFQELINNGVPAKDARILVATAKSESGLNPTIRGDGGMSIGLFQIHMPSHYDKLSGFTGSMKMADWINWLNDPINNIKAGAAVYKSQGLGAWTEYNNGNYEKYLNIVDSTSTSSTGSPKLPGDKISAYKPTTWEKIKDNILDAWYWGLGTDQQRVNMPTADEQIQARKFFNQKYGTELNTEALQRESDFMQRDDIDILESGIIGVFILMVIIIGLIAFFKAFNVSVPAALPGPIK